MNILIEAICLFLKSYLSIEDFMDFVYKNDEEIEQIVDGDTYLEVISVNISDSISINEMRAKLENYIINNYKDDYDSVHDAYVDKIVDSTRTDFSACILRKAYEREALVEIDCAGIKKYEALIDIIKRNLAFPEITGNSWGAIEDFIFDIRPPYKIVFKNWSSLTAELPQDATVLKGILDKLKYKCEIEYLQ